MAFRELRHRHFHTIQGEITMSIRKTLGLTAAGLIATTTAAQALPPHLPNLVQDGNRWEITAYVDASPGHQELATQGLCFYFAGVSGTHQLYYWVSDTFPDWNGRATQEGDHVFMHGDYAGDVGHDGMEWEIVTVSPKNMGAGHWKEWREDGQFGNTIGFANARLQRVGRCEYDDHNQAWEAYKYIGYPRDQFGVEIKLPIGSVDRETIDTLLIK